MTLSDWAAVASAIFAGTSALVAAAAIYLPSRTQASQRLLEQAQLSLERAYDALTDGGENISPPRPDRLNWLTAARHIERYKILRSKLTDETHRTICEEQEEYWRHRIYLVLESPDLVQPTYYMHRLAPDAKQPIEPRSAVVVHAFAKWPEGRTDPIDAVDINTLVAQTKLFNGKPGLRSYIEQNT